MFSQQNIQKAGVEHILELLQLLNDAYRGEQKGRAWTGEGHLISGAQRTDFAELEQLIDLPGSVFLIYTLEEYGLVGCVNLQHKANRMYVGMLAVSPQMQAYGIGRALLAAAEAYALEQNCKYIEMTVISERTDLIDWYKRRGYINTGITKPFLENERSGLHKKVLAFLLLEKEIGLE
jgi:ribosomal protein S18 acetylase RimI-like enzyme